MAWGIFVQMSSNIPQAFQPKTLTPMLGSTRIALIATTLLVLGLIGLYSSAALHLVRAWANSADFSHGWLILPVSLYLIWLNRNKWLGESLRPSWTGVLVLCAGGLIWLAGELANVHVVKGYGFVTMLQGVIVLIWGLKFCRINFFPLAFLYFMVPAGEWLNPVMMEHTASVVVWLLNLSGLPIFREGLHFTLPTGRWSVVEACSGFRYLLSALILSLLFAYLQFVKFSHRLLFVVVALLTAIIANWIRAYTIVLVGHFSNMKYGTGDDHVWYGWIIFGVVMAVVFWLGAKFATVPLPTAISAEPNPAIKAAAANDSASVLKLGSLAALVIAGLVSVGIWSALPARMQTFDAQKGLATTLAKSFATVTEAEFPIAPGFADPIERATIKDGQYVAQIAYFAVQHQRKDMLGMGQRAILESDSLTRIVSRNPDSLQLDAQKIKSTKYYFRSRDKSFVMWHWFVVGNYSTNSPYLAKAYRLLNLVRGQGDHSASVMIMTEVPDASKPLTDQELGVLPFAFKLDAQVHQFLQPFYSSAGH
jgi:exosortase A